MPHRVRQQLSQLRPARLSQRQRQRRRPDQQRQQRERHLRRQPQQPSHPIHRYGSRQRHRPLTKREPQQLRWLIQPPRRPMNHTPPPSTAPSPGAAALTLTERVENPSPTTGRSSPTHHGSSLPSGSPAL